VLLLAMTFGAASAPGSTAFEQLAEATEPIKRREQGRPRKRPEKPYAANDNKRCREPLREQRIKFRIARKGVESSEKLGWYR
jgi:hypothetical protein